MTKQTTPTNATANTQIHSRVLMVWLTISTWSARRYDKKITEKVNAEYSASSDAGRYNKFLLPGDCAAYKALVSLAGSIRLQHYSHTLAWSDEGWRILPTANYMDYTTWFRSQLREFNTALDAFVQDYPAMRDRARVLLNGMYKDEDYPSLNDLRKRFALGVQYSPLPNFGDVRVDLASDQIAEIEKSINDRITSAVGLAVQDAWKRLYDVTRHIQERLSDPTAIFRDSLIQNATDVCGVLARLNITNDPNLEDMRQRVLSQLTTFDPDTLRDNKRVRASVAKDASAIMAKMAAFYAPESE